MSQELASRCQFRAGDVIDHQYTIVNALGEGSFGAVYLAENHNRQKVALKLLRLWEVPAEIRDALLKRFDMEYETGQISSPYLVHSLDHGLVNGNPYIAMDYCESGDLYKIMEREYLDYHSVGYCILNGLKALHECGKVHRDLKPENVLRNQHGVYALTDFGISGDRNKRMTERNILGKPTQIMGTYAYMPPEQLTPHKEATVLPTTDIFSFGVLMYQIITRELPFGPLNTEKDLVAYIRNVKNGQWNKNLLLQTREGVVWESVVSACLEPNFKSRAQSADIVLKNLPAVITSQIKSQPIVIESNSFQKKIIHGLMLRIMQGEEYGKTYYLDDIADTNKRGVISIGRSSADVYNDIPIKEVNSSYISRRHCTLELDYEQGEWIIRDGQFQRPQHGVSGGWYNSTNGTYLNSSEVSAMGLVIKPGDIISIGDTKLRVEAY